MYPIALTRGTANHKICFNDFLKFFQAIYNLLDGTTIWRQKIYLCS